MIMQCVWELLFTIVANIKSPSGKHYVHVLLIVHMHGFYLTPSQTSGVCSVIWRLVKFAHASVTGNLGEP